ncbi:MAG: monofunctional biosynthetic peptidoglycan transglycosylase [Aestuariivita sp.]|nr:monofunctional biosynthetic peptidoglycan transglycosylase [Aestuariivita sp.]
MAKRSENKNMRSSKTGRNEPATKSGKSRQSKNISSVTIARRASKGIRKSLKVIFLGLIFMSLGSVLLILLFRIFNPPTTYFMWSEGRRTGGIEQEWVGLENINPVLLRSVVAAEDAHFCIHWGIDISAVRLAIAEGSRRGASTISQQTAKNLFLWPGRSWFRKALEAVTTLMLEALWSKKRILEVYLNIIEFDERIFGIEAAAQHHFGVAAAELTPVQSARLAVVLPAPKTRSAIKPSPQLQKMAKAVMDGAETIRLDGRSSCFENNPEISKNKGG